MFLFASRRMHHIRRKRRSLCSARQTAPLFWKNRKHRLRRQYRKKRLPCRYNRNERIPPRLKPNQFRKTRRLRFRRCRSRTNRRSQNAEFLGAGWQRELLPSHFSYLPCRRSRELPRRTVRWSLHSRLQSGRNASRKNSGQSRPVWRKKLPRSVGARKNRPGSKHFKTPICPIRECRMRN